MSSVLEKQKQLIEDFKLFDNWEERYEYIIQMGKKLPPIPDEKKKDDYLIKGCQSKVWLIASLKDDLVHFDADSDGILPKGVIAILLSVFNDQPAEEIINAPTDFIKDLGFYEFLSPSRANGLASMLKQIKFYAVALNRKSS